MTVYAIIQPTQRNSSGAYEPSIDLSPAKEFGDIVFLLPEGRPFDNPQSVIQQLRAKLYNFRPTDYILPVGQTLVIGWAVAIAAYATGGSINLLKWNKRQARYESIRASLW